MKKPTSKGGKPFEVHTPNSGFWVICQGTAVFVRFPRDWGLR